MAHATLYNDEDELPEYGDFSANIKKVLAAAEALAPKGIDCEVIDLRSLRPLDDETIMQSVRKMHRAIVVDEAWRSGSFAAEVACRIGEQAFFDLDAPVERVCSLEVPIPYSRHLEQAAIPQPEKIIAVVLKALRR